VNSGGEKEWPGCPSIESGGFNSAVRETQFWGNKLPGEKRGFDIGTEKVGVSGKRTE